MEALFLSSPEEPLTTWTVTWEGGTQPTVLPSHERAHERSWKGAIPYSGWYFLERKSTTGTETAFQEQWQRKNTQQTLGQLGQAVNEISMTGQGATEHDSAGSPF